MSCDVRGETPGQMGGRSGPKTDKSSNKNRLETRGWGGRARDPR